MKQHLQFTIGLPCRNRILFCNEALKMMLKNSPYPIIVIDDASDKPDGKYLKDERIRVIYNKKKKGIAHLWNQLIKSSQTEYVIICSDKIRMRKKDFSLIKKKIQEGFAFVAPYSFHCFSFSKYLTTKIGFFDEGFTNSSYEDSDFERRLYMADIGMYFTYETESVKFSTGWKATGENKNYYQKKWIENNTNKTLTLLHDEINIHERKLYKKKYSGKKYLPWTKSNIKIKELNSYFENLQIIDYRQGHILYKKYNNLRADIIRIQDTLKNTKIILSRRVKNLLGIQQATHI